MNVALVTGASRGIGRAIALRLAREGYAVVINYLRNRDKAEQVAQEIRSQGGQAMAFQADVSSFSACEQMIRDVERMWAPVQVLVNNAGESTHYDPEALPPEEWDRILSVNLSAAFYLSRLVIPQMKERKYGRIINMASLRAMTGSAHGPHYAAAKAGIIGLTKSLALALGPYGITVNAVSPGYTRTDMTRKALETRGDQIRAQIPLRREARPEEIAAVVAFLASEEAGYITGETIQVNGGIYVQ